MDRSAESIDAEVSLAFRLPDYVALAPHVEMRPTTAPLDWTVIIPFFNEQEFVAEALRCVAAQSENAELILVDNRSTDRSRVVAENECERLGLDYVLINERKPGKVHALAAGLAQVRTPFVATFDADTRYPASYLHAARQLLEMDRCVGAQAYYVRPHWGRARQRLAAAHLQIAAWLLPHQGHNGGAGQVFHADALRRAGGFDAERWDLILEDHEIIHRLTQLGRVGCSFDFWCCPSRRERDLPVLRWSFVERLAYHLTPARLQSKFFYDFLRPRLTKRGLIGLAARNRRGS